MTLKFAKKKNGGRETARPMKKSPVTAFADNFDDKPEVVVAKWMKERVSAEVARLKAAGQRSVPLPVKNCGIVREHGLNVHRVELATAFDFDKVNKIMISPPVACPHKAGHAMVFVVLCTKKPLPLIFGHLFSEADAPDLQEWLLVNSKLKHSRHSIQNLR
jgi:hypothetical protein